MCVLWGQVDNGNNSLVPPTHDRRLGQISTWYFPQAVDETQAPMLVVPKTAAPTNGAQPDRSVSSQLPAAKRLVGCVF